MILEDGYTLMHEHMSIDLSEGDLGTTSFDELCYDLKMVYDCGVRNIVDLTNQSMGRNPKYIERLKSATGVNIIMSTGYYLDQFIMPYVEPYSVKELSENAINDIEYGIDDTGVKANVIGEIAWSDDGETLLEHKTWEAMTTAANETGAIVSTHPSRGIQQIPQAEYLISKGISPGNIVIGHIEFYPDDTSLKKLLDMGVYIGLDMIGKEDGKGDSYRADTVCKIKEWGMLSQVLLSLDICRKENLKSYGGYGYVYLFEKFIPMLKSRGVTDDDIELMLYNNPRCIFGDE